VKRFDKDAMNSKNQPKGKHKYSALSLGETVDDDVDESAASDDPTSFVQKQIEKQNANLDALSISVSRLGDMSLSISNEISSQNRLLSDLDSDIENVSAKTDSLLKKTKEIIKKTGGIKDWCIILILILVLSVLVLLVIYS